MEETIRFIVNTDSKKLSEEDDGLLYDLSLNGVEIEPKEDDVPFAIDAGFTIEDEDLVIGGSVGYCGFGSVEITLPLAKVNSFYKFSIQANDPIDAEEIKTILEKYNYTLNRRN